jgi:hypothetical protein
MLNKTLWEEIIVDGDMGLDDGAGLFVADLDGDGEAELVVGEHDLFYPYRSRCNLFVYKKYDRDGHYWKRYSIEDRFEHHDGTRIMRMASGELAVLSHGWNDERYISLWRFEK